MKTCPNCKSTNWYRRTGKDLITLEYCSQCHYPEHKQDETTKIRLTPPVGTGRTMAPMTHDLKIQSKYFEAIQRGEKRFEVRKNDRMYQVGDILRLHEITKPNSKEESRTIEVEVTYILYGGLFGVDPDYCVLSIRAFTVSERFVKDVTEILVDKATELEEKSERLKDEAEKEIKDE